MAELLALGSKKMATFSMGQRVEATVLSKSDKAVIFDIGGKSEGIVKEKAYSDAKEFISRLNVGDTVKVTVLVPETRDGITILALRDAVQDIAWSALEKALKEDSEIVVLGKGLTQSGFAVDFSGLEGFIPTSQLGKEVSREPEILIGKYFKVKVVEVNKPQNKIVLSEKEISDAGDIKLSKEALKKIKEGDVYEGVVTTVANFGVFVKFKVGKSLPAGRQAELEGLVHVSEISYSKVSSPSDVLKVGDKVKVKIIGIRDLPTQVGGKIALSIKQSGKDPWSEVEKKYKVEGKVSGKIVKISDFGAFVELEPGVEGLIHITKIPPTQKVEIGQEVKCVIEDINIKDKRIALGMVLTSVPVGYK